MLCLANGLDKVLKIEVKAVLGFKGANLVNGRLFPNDQFQIGNDLN